MIRRATAAEIPDSAVNESLIRICALKEAYEGDVPFIQFFTDDSGGYLSIMDGVGILYSQELSDEWSLFLHMNPDIRILHCPGNIGGLLADEFGWQGREGVVMKYAGGRLDGDPTICTSPHLPDVYHLLQECFPGIAPLEYWYPDASHRLRHGQCHIGCIMRDEQVVSTAMTVAETETEAILGQVATAAPFRRQGMAETCIKSVIFQCKGKTLYILPLNDTAQKLYTKLGFTEYGTWAELHKQ